VILANDKLLLREFRQQDWVDVHKYASQEVVSRYQTWGPNSEEDTKEFIQDALDEATQTPRERYVFAIIHQETVIGAVEMMIKDFTNKVGEIGYIVNPKEGVLRENMLMKDGVWRDSLLYSMLKQEWLS